MLALLALAACAVGLWVFWNSGDSGGSGSLLLSSNDGEGSTLRRPSANAVDRDARANAEDSESRPESSPALIHIPDSGPIVPFDMTNLADESLGKSLWIQFTNNTAEWNDLWRALHAHEAHRSTAVEDPSEAGEFDARTSAILAVGLGVRERMDYGFTLEPVKARFNEKRYRLRIFTVPTPPVEVVSRPARVWLIPTGDLGNGGLVIEDEHGNEIRNFEKPPPPFEEDDPEETEDH
ncbi:MAG: hypothetical protein HY286_03115 [Planctomycetes bacterium]|nr:hypothetical protein [Planctomycetota bacterium]